MTRGTNADGVPLETLLEHRAWVRALARRLVSDPNAADDVEQETWRMALERPPRHGASVRGWFAAVVRNAARMAGRGRSRRARHEALAPERPRATSPADVVAEAEVQHRLVGAVLALDEPYRSAVLAQFFEGREATEIAAASGVPVETVRTRIKRGVAMLRARMAEEIGDDRDAWCLLLVGPRPADGPPLAPGRAGSGAGSGAAAGTGAGTALTGGLAMGVASKIAVGVAAVLVALVAWTLVDRDTGDVASRVPESGAADDAAAHGRATHPRAAVPGDSQATVGAASSGNARLDAADRDLDLFGVVVRKDGTPVPGASVQAVSYPWRRVPALTWEGRIDAVPGPATTTDADGVFVLRLRRGENVALRVTKPGFAQLELAERQAGEQVRVVLEPGVRLVVTAKDASGAPLPAVRLRVSRMLSLDQRDVEVERRATTGADGTCVFADLPGGLDGRVFTESSIGCAPLEFKLPDGGESRVDLVLEAGRTIRGRVTDRTSGAAVVGATVGMAWPLVGAVTSGADGAYELRGWGARTYRDVQVVAQGFVRASDEPGARDTVDFALTPGVRVRGRVVGPDGAPLAGACVSAVATGRDAAFAVGRTGTDGVFHLTDLDGSALQLLTAFAVGGGRVERAVSLPAGLSDEHDLGDVELPAPRAIEGVALDPSGRPAPRAVVAVTGPEAPPALAAVLRGRNRESRRADDLGRFRFPDLAPGRYVVELVRRDGTQVSAQVTLPADRDVLDVVVPPQQAADGSYAVTVTDDAGQPVAGAPLVGRTNDGTEPARATTDRAGRAVVGPAPTGRVTRIELGTPLAGGPYLLHPGVRVSRERREVRIALRRGIAVSYRIVDADGEPLPMAQVSVEPAGQAMAGMSHPDGTGSIVVPRDGVFALLFDGAVTANRGGAWTVLDTGLEARADGITAASGEVVLRCRRVATGRSMTVRVAESDGTAAIGIGMTILTGGGVRLAHGVTDDAGRARFDGLPGRNLTVFVGAREGDLHPGLVRAVPEGQEVVVRFPAAVEISGTATWSDGTPVAAYVNVYRVGAGSDEDADDTFVHSAVADADGRFAVKMPVGDDGPFEIEAATQRADRTYTGVRRPLAPSDRDVRLVVPR